MFLCIVEGATSNIGSNGLLNGIRSLLSMKPRNWKTRLEKLHTLKQTRSRSISQPSSAANVGSISPAAEDQEAEASAAIEDDVDDVTHERDSNETA